MIIYKCDRCSVEETEKERRHTSAENWIKSTFLVDEENNVTIIKIDLCLSCRKEVHDFMAKTK